MENTINLMGLKGSGSVIAEAFLILAGISYDYEEVNYDIEGPAKKRLVGYNPLGQVPTLIFSDGSVITETLAVAAYADSKCPGLALLPRDAATAARFFRWTSYIIAAIYPTFTYGDTPTKWVNDSNGAKQLGNSTDLWRKKLWSILDKEAGNPYFFGKTFSAIDIYLGVMIHWEPRRDWFRKNCPNIHLVAELVGSDKRLAELWARNFD